MLTVTFSEHATVRMLQRRITPKDIRTVFTTGEVIEHLPHRQPQPTWTMLGWVSGRPLHVVYCQIGSGARDHRHVITVYEPKPGKWDTDFRRRT